MPGFSESEPGFQDQIQPLGAYKTRSGGIQDAPRCPQERPKSAQDDHKSDFGSILDGFWLIKWKQISTKIGSKIDINFESQKPTKR